jgi:RecA-family ATPase
MYNEKETPTVQGQGEAQAVEHHKDTDFQLIKQVSLIPPPDFNLNGLPPVKENSFLNIRPMNDWINEAKNQKTPSKLFSNFWFESEMVILFASGGVGKTILAYQIATGITEGKKILIFEPEIIPQPVLYCDFELSAKQIEGRYSKDWQDHYIFNDYLLRAVINTDSEIPDNVKFEEFIIQQIEQAIIKKGAKILMIDNITILRDDQEKAKDALKLMKQLNQLKAKYQLSILVLAHTPKRDASRPISRNDISGSAMILNFTDSAFAIGESANDPDVRYLKQVKSGRYDSIIYDANNVVVCSIANNLNFTQYEFIDFGKEEEHLKQFNQKADRDAEIFKLNEQGLSSRKIAPKVNLSHTTVSKILKNDNPF